ncbi:MAG: hypothetical protein AB8G05_15245 [Oligoflexales bacterium]
MKKRHGELATFEAKAKVFTKNPIIPDDYIYQKDWIQGYDK